MGGGFLCTTAVMVTAGVSGCDEAGHTDDRCEKYDPRYAAGVAGGAVGEWPLGLGGVAVKLHPDVGTYGEIADKRITGELPRCCEGGLLGGSQRACR